MLVLLEKQSALGSPFFKLLTNSIKFETNERKDTASQGLQNVETTTIFYLLTSGAYLNVIHT